MTPKTKRRERVQLSDRHKEITAAHEDPQVQQVPLDKIRTDGGTQMRAAIDEELVKEYAKLIHDGIPFRDAPEVCYDGTHYWLWDGFHRIAAYRKAYEELKLKPDSIPCKVQQGDRRKAIVLAAGANDAHGKRRTNADKQRAVETFLRDDEWQRMTDAWIAEKCKVDPKTVAAHRERLVANQEIPDLRIRKAADGRVIDTSGMGSDPRPRRQLTQPKRAPAPSEIRNRQSEAEPAPHEQPSVPAPVEEPPRPESVSLPNAPSPADSVSERKRNNIVRLDNVNEYCELMLDGLSDFEDITGHFDTGHEARKILRKIQEQIREHLAIVNGGHRDQEPSRL